MRVRAERHAALGWLGIETYQPSGRVTRPSHGESSWGRALDAAEVPAEEVAEYAVSLEIFDDQPAETPIGPAPAAEEDTAPSDQPPTREESSSEMPVPAEEVVVARGSIHAALAEVIAGWAGLQCREPTNDEAELAGGTGEAIIVDGQRWTMAEIAADGKTKRLLWKALVTRLSRDGLPRTS